MFDYLPENVKKEIVKKSLDKLTEIRLYQSGQVFLRYDGKLRPLACNDGKNTDIFFEKCELNRIVERLTLRSLYAFNDKIVHGFLTGKDGERIGLAGEFVFDGNGIKTIKNYSSLNVRIHRNVKGCSDELLDILPDNGLFNIMIFSKPGMGKTTMIRDVVQNIAKTGKYSILVVDERDEIISGTVLPGVDVLKNCTKKYAFENGIRSLAPDLIVTDELFGVDDFSAVERAINAGVKVVATAHANDVKLFRPYIFDFYVQLSGDVIGKIYKIFDKNGEEIIND